MFANIHGAVITMPTSKVGADKMVTQKSVAAGEPAPLSLICSTYKIIWPMALTMVVIYSQNMICFPGLILNGNWNFLPKENPWRTVAIIGSWNTCEAIGRYAPSFCNKHLPPKPLIWLIAGLKFFLVYATLLCVKSYNSQSEFFMSMPVQVTNLIANSLLYGVLGTYTMILGTTNKRQPGYSQKVAGYLMASHMILGLGLGATSGFMINSLVVKKSAPAPEIVAPTPPE